MLAVFHGYSLNPITFVTEETVNGDNIAEQNIMSSIRKKFPILNWLNNRQYKYIIIWLFYISLSTDSFQYSLHSPRFVFPRFRKIAKIAGNSTIHIYKSAAEFEGTLFSLSLSFSLPAALRSVTSDRHRIQRTGFDCRLRGNCQFSPNYVPLYPSRTHLSTSPIYIVKQNPRGRDLSAAVERDVGADRCGADRGITDPACPRGRKSERT